MFNFQIRAGRNSFATNLTRISNDIQLQFMNIFYMFLALQFPSLVFINFRIQKMSLKNFDILGQLGTGSFASVYKVRRHEDHQIYALKKVRLLTLSQKQKENALNQIRILASIKNPNIIAYKQSFLDRQTATLCLVTEYADGGDLQRKIIDLKQKKQLATEDQIWSTFTQISKALKSLHSMNIAHRDLKSANVFLFKNGKVKIGDMNVSKIIKNNLCLTQTGTPYYASPEVWRDVPYNTKSDVWSLGCLIYEMITLHPPFMAENMQGLYKKILKGIYPKISHKYSKSLRNLVRMMLQVDPECRPPINILIQYAENALNKGQKNESNDFCRIRATQSAKNIETNQKKETEMNQKENEEEDCVSLLGTIRFPKKIGFLGPKLPKANYQGKECTKKKTVRNLPSIQRPRSIIQESQKQKLMKIRSEKLLPLPLINLRNIS